jgi:hypothetical protein
VLDAIVITSRKKVPKHTVPTAQSASDTPLLPTPSTLPSDDDGWVPRSEFKQLLGVVKDLSEHHTMMKHTVRTLEGEITALQEGMETFGRVLNALRPQQSEAAGWTSNLQFPFSSLASPIDSGPSAFIMPVDSPPQATPSLATPPPATPPPTTPPPITTELPASPTPRGLSTTADITALGVATPPPTMPPPGATNLPDSPIPQGFPTVA